MYLLPRGKVLILSYKFIHEVKTRADIRIRIRGGVIRIRIEETAVRTVIRVTTHNKGCDIRTDIPFSYRKSIDPN